MSMSLSGCGVSSASGTTADDSSSIISVNNTEPQSKLIPGNTNEMGGDRIIRYLWEGLVAFDADGKMKLEGAESITPNADSTQYTIKLKQGWKFTNGEDVTAKSYAKAWSYTANATNAQKQASRMSVIAGYDDLQKKGTPSDAQLSGVQVVDDYTLKVTLNAPDSVFPTQLSHQAFFPLPSVAYEDMDKYGSAPIGDGPYKFKEWDHNHAITVVKNPDYQGSRTVKNGGIEFRVYTDENAAYADVQAGNLDVLDTIPGAHAKSFRNDSKVIAVEAKGSTIDYMAVPAWDDELHAQLQFDEQGLLRRKAISMAIDRESIVDKIFNGTRTVSTDFAAPTIPGASDSLKGSEYLKYNATEAKKLWAQADAIEPWKGKITIAYAADGDGKEWVPAAANTLKNTLGVDAQAVVFPTISELLTAVANKSAQVTMISSGWATDYPSLEDYTQPLYASWASINITGFSSNKFDSLIKEALTKSDTNEQNTLFQEAEEVLLDQLPTIPLWTENAVGVSSKKVTNVKIDYMGVPVYNELTRK